MSWDNEDIPVGSENCPDCFGSLDDEGYGYTCGCTHGDTCDTCGAEAYCAWSC